MADFVTPGREVAGFDYVVLRCDWMYQGFDSIIEKVN